MDNKTKAKVKTHFRNLLNDKRGDLMQLPINLLMAFITITFLIALIPGFVQMVNLAQQSNYLNCAGYVYNGQVNNTLSYNSSLGTNSTIGCLAITLYIPYITLGVLIGVVALIFYGKSFSQTQQPGGYGY